MAHIPYGYKIINGKAQVDEEQAAVVQKLFEGYIAGLGLKAAVENAGLDISHSSVGRMLRNIHYLGDNYYPAIIKRELFDKAEEIRISRAVALGRIRELTVKAKPVIETNFFMLPLKKSLKDPVLQAEYVYSLIESEVTVVE